MCIYICEFVENGTVKVKLRFYMENVGVKLLRDNNEFVALNNLQRKKSLNR